MSKEDFYSLTPNDVMGALESQGFQPTGLFVQLNSYENRVFDVQLEDKTRVVTKFYRPGRWSLETILEEHEFLADLTAEGLPAVAPLPLKNRSTAAEHQGMYFTVFPKAMGRMIDELQIKDFHKIGRNLAQMHNVGEQRESHFRPQLSAESYGWDNLPRLKDWVAPEVRHRYFAAAEEVLDQLDHLLPNFRYFRIHGDCHRGNILRTDRPNEESLFFFIDFDDFCIGPAVQDLWMLLSAAEDTEEGQIELDTLLDGYREFRHFNDDELELIPWLRGLRIIHYATWIARRWEDPSFPRLFPQFKDFNYWARETEALEKICAAHPKQT